MMEELAKEVIRLVAEEYRRAAAEQGATVEQFRAVFGKNYL